MALHSHCVPHILAGEAQLYTVSQADPGAPTWWLHLLGRTTFSPCRGSVLGDPEEHVEHLPPALIILTNSLTAHQPAPIVTLTPPNYRGGRPL